MSRKVGMFSIALCIMLFIGMRWDLATNVAQASNERMLTSPTLLEQRAFVEFIGHLNDQAPPLNMRNQLLLVEGGSLQKIVRNFEVYIDVKELLKTEENAKEPVRQLTEVPIEQPQEVQKKIALTFDDGPHQVVTNLVLEILQKYQVKATFFMLGQNAAKYPDLVQQIDARGHEIANHSWSHQNFTKLTKEQLNAEINQTNAAIFDAIHKYPKAYRPPYGAIDENVRTEITLMPVLWNIDTLDWQHKTPAITLENVKLQAKDGGILLMHDIHPESAQALEAVIVYLIGEGYEFVTTSELLDY